ncbi:MAG: cofactor-independent phosphoglycerate mutase [Thermogutta sp.]
MKFVIVIPDGCADEPQAELGGKTPLQAAQTPHMDAVAAAGVCGLANHVPLALPPGSDTANLSLLGYDPIRYYTGRAPLEAAAQGIALGSQDWAIRCNLVTIRDRIMVDFTAGHITSEEARLLIAAIQERLGSERLQFHPGVSYRNLAVYRGEGEPAPFSAHTRTTPPHDLMDRSVLDDFPRGPGSELLTEWMNAGAEILASHPINAAREKAGKLPATGIWLWGLGGTPQLPPFDQCYGVRGAMITAVDLLRGLACLMGWDWIEVPGATGYLDTDYAAKGRYAVEALRKYDLVCVHVEATDEASHQGQVREKVQALEEIDRHIVGPIWEALRELGEFRLLVSPDHPTPLRTKTHSHGLVPFALAGTGLTPSGAKTYDEAAASAGPVFDPGWQLMGYFLGTASREATAAS